MRNLFPPPSRRTEGIVVFHDFVGKVLAYDVQGSRVLFDLILIVSKIRNFGDARQNVPRSVKVLSIIFVYRIERFQEILVFAARSRRR